MVKRKDNLIKVKTLGGFTISDDSGKVFLSDRTNRSRKALSLLEYLIINRPRDIPIEELSRILWPDDRETQVNTLKALLHRCRMLLGDMISEYGDVIVSGKGSYSWNSELNMDVDVDEFASLCAHTDDVQSLLRAADIYEGDFLVKYGDERWIMPLSARYHAMYIDTVHRIISMLDGTDRYEDLLSVCQRAETVDPYDDSIRTAALKCLIGLERSDEALEYYNKVTELFMDRFGITPGPEFTAMYKSLVKTERNTERNINIIEEDLREKGSCSGAFYCEFAFFKDMYQLYARDALRGGGVVQLGVISVVNGMPQRQLSLIMRHMKDIIYQSLRSSDVFSRFSTSQYIILFPNARQEDGNMVLERVAANFRRAYPHSSAVLHCKSMPLQPAVSSKN